MEFALAVPLEVASLHGVVPASPTEHEVGFTLVLVGLYLFGVILSPKPV